MKDRWKQARNKMISDARKMLVVELSFLCGRYHATAWGRNVNEGEAEWPPSPYRLARALVDVWYRRRTDWPAERVQPLLEALSSAVRFQLPPSRSHHTRSYLSSNSWDPNDKQLVFDAFVAMDRNESVLLGFEATLPEASVQDLDDLLSELNYLGRSESLCRARAVQDPEGIEWNCVPIEGSEDSMEMNRVRVACVRSPEDYDRLASRAAGVRWFDALCMSTGQLLKEGWSDPPALLWTDYALDRQNLMEALQKKTKSKPSYQTRYRVARYALSSKVLPSIKETLPLAERVRAHLMGIHKRICEGDSSLVSSRFSGKDSLGRPLKDHHHAFFLPLDEDGDGRLDHVMVMSGEPFDVSEVAALDRFRSVWQTGGRPDVFFVLVSLSEDYGDCRSCAWVSATPYVTGRHYRRGRGTFEEWLSADLLKECGFHGLPLPMSVEWIQETRHTTKSVRWLEFIRSRKEKPDRRGFGCILRFDQPVAGPFALGSGCHFGLGLFVPINV
jgi:CRISPR-associated protein Csb2